MGCKMFLLRDVMLTCRDLARHYVSFGSGVSWKRMVNIFVKEAYDCITESTNENRASLTDVVRISEGA